MTMQIYVIDKYDADVLEAKRLAHEQYDRYFPLLYPYVYIIKIFILKELRAPEGLIGYVIRVSIECTEEEFEQMKRAMQERARPDFSYCDDCTSYHAATLHEIPS